MPKPGRIDIKGARYRATVLLIVSKNTDGTPRELRMIADNEKVDVTGSPEFMIVYAPVEMLRGEN